ncbi:hypothetical protein BGZ57DRAFT_972313 [Hyaloscypha finlandica]|nr:hypothetical protein BGZ57DRAFT_972313 [Hyaloscypha finlandica]
MFGEGRGGGPMTSASTAWISRNRVTVMGNGAGRKESMKVEGGAALSHPRDPCQRLWNVACQANENTRDNERSSPASEWRKPAMVACSARPQDRPIRRTEGASSTMSAKATPISVRRAEGERNGKLLMSRTKGLVALPRRGWRLEVSAKQSGVTGRIHSRSRSITAPPESGTIEEVMRVAGWHLGTFACTPESIKPIASSTANDALSVLPKGQVARSTVGYSTVPSLGSLGRRVKAKGAVGLEEAHTWFLA